MTKQRELVGILQKELENNPDVQALILYGSVSRNEETDNSDIDLLVIVKEQILQKRHVIRDGITVEFVEESFAVLADFVEKWEMPMLFALAYGEVLFTKTDEINTMVMKAREMLKDGPKLNPRWETESYRIKKRSDLTEIYLDMLDVEDEVSFHYLVSVLLNTALPIMLELNHSFIQTRKRMIPYIQKNCPEEYSFISKLLKPEISIKKKKEAAKGLINFIFRDYGGVLEGDAVIFRKTDV